MELGVPARLRPEPEGRAVVEVSGRTHPSFCEAFDARIGGRDGTGGVRSGPAITAGNGGVATRTDADRRELPVSVDRPAALARASVLHRRARDVARTEEESRCCEEETRAMLEHSWWRPVKT
ncbi:unnamed protein product, partial [Trichogramma brassicae]